MSEKKGAELAAEVLQAGLGKPMETWVDEYGDPSMIDIEEERQGKVADWCMTLNYRGTPYKEAAREQVIAYARAVWNPAKNPLKECYSWHGDSYEDVTISLPKGVLLWMDGVVNGYTGGHRRDETETRDIVLLALQLLSAVMTGVPLDKEGDLKNTAARLRGEPAFELDEYYEEDGPKGASAVAREEKDVKERSEKAVNGMSSDNPGARNLVRFADVVIDVNEIVMVQNRSVWLRTQNGELAWYGVGKEAADAIRSYFTPASGRCHCKSGQSQGTSDKAPKDVPALPGKPACSAEADSSKAQGQSQDRSCGVTSSPADGSAGGEDGTSAEEGASTEAAKKAEESGR